MSKKGNRFIYIPLISFLLLFGCPFTISADTTIVPTFAGTSSQTDWNEAGGHVTEYHEIANSANGVSRLRFTFDDHYYGFVSFTYYFGSSTYNYGDVFIADGEGDFYYRNSSGSQNYITAVRIDSVILAIPDSNVDLTQIINILTAIEGHTGQTILEIEDVIDQLIISNGYLETISQLRQWDVPIESYTLIDMMINNNVEISERITDNYYNFPIFNLKNGNYIVNLTDSFQRDYYFIFGINRYVSNASITNWLEFGGMTIVSQETINYYDNQGNGAFFLKKITLRTNANQRYIKYIGSVDTLFVPIYFNDTRNKYLSTDFSLLYGLSNKLLDNLDIIANGTTQSNSAAGSNDTATNEFEGVAGDMYDYEDSFNSDMNSSLNQIDTNFNIGSQFGSKFSASAQWVSQQFNTLTASTPFGSVISFSLLLGLALLIIGKVLR